MFATFGEQHLDHVDNNTLFLKLTEWKTNPKIQAAYNKLFTNHEFFLKIRYSMFKQYKGKELPTMHYAYILLIYNILLNPKSSGIKCNNKSVVRHVNAFLVNNIR